MSDQSAPGGRAGGAGVRASDAERDAIADELRAHAIAGRLDTDELEERLQAAYTARTTADLQALRRDLPALPASPQQVALERKQQRAQLVRRSVQETGGSACAFVVCAVIWGANGANGFFWPVFVLIAVAASVVRSMWDLYGPGADLDAVEAKLDAKREHHDRHDERRAEHRARHDERRRERHERRGL